MNYQSFSDASKIKALFDAIKAVGYEPEQFKLHILEDKHWQGRIATKVEVYQYSNPIEVEKALNGSTAYSNNQKLPLSEWDVTKSRIISKRYQDTLKILHYIPDPEHIKNIQSFWETFQSIEVEDTPF